MARDSAYRLRRSSRFVGGIEYAGSRIPLFRALMANLVEVVAVVDVVFTDPQSFEGFEIFFLPILLKRARFCCVNGAGSQVGCVARARFVRGSALSSLSSCRSRGDGFTGTCSSWVGGSSACRSFGEACFLSMMRNEEGRETYCPDELVDRVGRRLCLDLRLGDVVDRALMKILATRGAVANDWSPLFRS